MDWTLLRSKITVVAYLLMTMKILVCFTFPNINMARLNTYPALKHHTSKLFSFDELSVLSTFGFRGEALASLCAVSTFRITTAQANEAPKASRLEFETSGKLKGTQVVAGSKGTTASVENLFRQLPVRRRELERNIKREYGKVLGLLHAYACISTGVKFMVKNQIKGKNAIVFSTHMNRTTKENISNIYGAKTLLALTPLELELEYKPSLPARIVSRQRDDEVNKVIVHGYISKPVFGEGRQTPDRQMIFVNSRPCGLPQISKAFNEIYKSFNIAQSPFIFADFEMDTGAYDVNVSPDKRSILLHDAGALIEQLKSKLTDLFNSLDQTVPQSEITSVGVKPPEVSDWRREIAASTRTSETPRQSSHAISNDGSDQSIGIQKSPLPTSRILRPPDRISSSSPQKKPVQSVDSLGKTSEKIGAVPERPYAQFKSVTAHGLPTEDIPEIPKMQESESQEEKSHDPHEMSQSTQSSQSSERQIAVLQQSPIKEKPSIIQNAFERMRPMRIQPQVARITVGDRTIQSTLDGSKFTPAKRRIDHSGTSNPRKRVQASPQRRLGKALSAFVAPGTQTEHDDESIEEMTDDDASPEEESLPRDAQFEHSARLAMPQNKPNDEEPEDTEMLYVPEEHPVQAEDEKSDSDESYVDEATKKVREDAHVAKLIQEAEEKASIPSDNTLLRAKRLSRARGPTDSTLNLACTIDGSLQQIQSGMYAIQIGLERKSLEAEALHLSRDEPQNNPEQAGETKLSLTVTKDDFARMRIAGQFNLGFILGIRPADLSSNQYGHRHDELFIIDQHASDEKYNFERLQSETVVQNQRLVKPKTLDLTAIEEEIIIENILALEKNGFVVRVDQSGDEPIGRRCKLMSLPLSKEVVFDSTDLEELLVLLSEAPASSKGDSVAELYIPRPNKVRKMFAMRACRSSIMVGKTLTEKQMESIVKHMGTIEKPWNCPHGRPTMRHLFSFKDWETWDEWRDVKNEQINEEFGNGLNVWQKYMASFEQESDSNSNEEDE